MKANFVFPGQGAQHENMGMDFYERHPIYKDTVEEASQFLKEDLAALMADGTKLQDTLHAQKAIYVMGVALTRLLEAHGIKGRQFLGLSLGEYTALAAAGVLSFETGLRLLEKRAQLMQQAVLDHPGFMVAVKNTPPKILEEALAEEEGLYLSNLNAPGQTVLGGRREKRQRLQTILEDIQCGGFVELPVAGAFHTPLMESAGKGFHTFLQETLPEMAPQPTVLSNLKGDFYQAGDDLKDILARHIYGPVRLTDCLGKMDAREGDLTLLLGPGKTLMPIARGNKLGGRILTVESVKSFEKLIETMGGN